MASRLDEVNVAQFTHSCVHVCVCLWKNLRNPNYKRGKEKKEKRKKEREKGEWEKSGEYRGLLLILGEIHLGQERGLK